MSDRRALPWGQRWRGGGSMTENQRHDLADELESMGYWANTPGQMVLVVCHAMRVLRGDLATETSAPREKESTDADR